MDAAPQCLIDRVAPVLGAVPYRVDPWLAGLLCKAVGASRDAARGRLAGRARHAAIGGARHALEGGAMDVGRDTVATWTFWNFILMDVQQNLPSKDKQRGYSLRVSPGSIQAIGTCSVNLRCLRCSSDAVHTPGQACASHQAPQHHHCPACRSSWTAASFCPGMGTRTCACGTQPSSNR